MNWEAVSAIGEVVGALLVALTLAFLVVQVRQNSKALNATTTQANIAGFNELNRMLAASPQLAEVFDRGSADPSRLTATEAYSYAWIVRSFLNLFLNLYDQFLQGTCPEALWRRHAMELQAFAKSPGVREFLKDNSYYHVLMEYIDSLPSTPNHRLKLNLRAEDGQRRDT